MVSGRIWRIFRGDLSLANIDLSGIDLQIQLIQETETPVDEDVRLLAKTALLKLLEPLAGFVLDSGLSANEMHSLFREAAVRSAVAKQLELSDRINISGIAATTGIPRSEISRILKSSAKAAEINNDSQQQSTNRILAAWYTDPKFTGPNGQPAELKIYGRGVSFDTLAKKYGLGIPTRAVLDELIRAGTIEMLPGQRIRARASMVIDRGMSARVVKAFGDRAAELLSTMLLNMRKPETPKFVASVSDASILSSALPLFRKELSVKGADFLAEVQESLNRKPITRVEKNKQKKLARVSVTIYCHESFGSESKGRSGNKRRNLRREI